MSLYWTEESLHYVSPPKFVSCGEGVQLNSRGEHIVGRIHLEDLGNSFVEVHDFLMFLVPGLIASDVKCRCASSMLRELVAVLLRGSPGK